MGGPYYLTAGPLDFGGCGNVILQFQRWLNSDIQSRVRDTVEVSSNGTSWIPVFVNSSSAITQSAWSNCQYNIAAIADNQTHVYVRWGYQVTSSRARAYSGWNIDDISFLGQLPLQLSASSRKAIAPQGTPMSWLAQYGLTNDGFNVEELLDSDGDGIPNWKEYVAGTDPTDSNSTFRIIGMDVSGGSNRLVWLGGNTNLPPFLVLCSTNTADISSGWYWITSVSRSATGTNTWLNIVTPGFYKIVATNSP